MRIVVTASATELASALLPLLAAEARYEQIIGVDTRDSGFRHERFTQILLDIRSPQLARVLAGAHAVVHLDGGGEIPQAHAEPASLRDPIVNGGQNVFRCAAQQHVRRVVHLSGAAVYALPARRRPIDEDHPRAALPGFGLAESLVALETWLDAFEQEHRDIALVRLRPHLIVGRHGPASVRRLLHLPFSLRLRGSPPRLQCVHAADVAQAVQLALTREVAGAFNLACADAAGLPQMQRFAGRGALSLPLPLYQRLLRMGAGIDPAWAEVLRHEIVLDTTRAREQLGWKPQYDSVRRCIEASA